MEQPIVYNQTDYAIYKGDTFLYIGNRRECAKFLNVKEDTINFYTTPTYKRRIKEEYNNRIIIVKMEEKTE